MSDNSNGTLPSSIAPGSPVGQSSAASSEAVCGLDTPAPASGAASSFTSQEETHDGSEGGSIRILGRFLANLPLLLALAVPSVLLSIAATSGLQSFTWLTGVFTECVADQPCQVTIPYFDNPIILTLAFLASFAALATVLRIIGWVFFEVGGQVAALGLFSRVTGALARTRTTFFDENPSGRILNRLTRDFEQLRLMGPIRVGDSLNALIELFVIGVVIGLAHPIAGLAVVPSFLLFLYIQRQISPMLQFCIVRRSIRFGEVLHRETDAIEGVRVFELYGQSAALFQRLKRAMESFCQTHLLRARIEAWGRFWSSTASAACSSIALLAVAVALDRDAISAPVAAVVITAALRLSNTFGWLMWTIGYLFETAGHAKRVFEYVDLPGEESEEGSPSHEPSVLAKPEDARVEFINYTMSYRRDTPKILDQLSLTIPNGAHVGIVGRTGAGKSSLVQALFRMVYVHSGDIRIGGVSLFSVPVAQARRMCAVMPQEPYLFAGNLRDNLDPQREYPDQRLKEVLQLAQLDFSLDGEVSEGGANFSVGQRQLVGLARILLSPAPVVIMDEPTSSVDTVTDETIQRLLRQHLAGRTVITIAHRLETLRTSDIVIELAGGRIVRQGSPSTVLPEVESDLAELLGN